MTMVTGTITLYLGDSATVTPILIDSGSVLSPSTSLSSGTQSLQLRLDQAWFWTEGWQKMEREADEDLKAGRYDEFESMDDFISDLKRLL